MEDRNNSVVFTDKIHEGNMDTSKDTVAVSAEMTSHAKVSDDDPVELFDCCLVDHSGRQFACAYDHCQHQSSCFKTDQLQEKLIFHELRFHPEDRMIWCKESFPDILKFIGSETIVEFPDYRFIFNHRYIRKDGSISQFMHEGSLTFTNDIWMPILNLKVFFEIADIKSDETIVLTLFRYDADNGYQKVFSKEYGGICSSFLSKRELEIIKLCHEGMSSKMIAEKLNLSIHTVKNHKRNSMEKTTTHNITELIHYCIKSNWM
ncbi:MAG: helix-turn-helix transcriptional regulator [Bacteroidota bacterium]|nr:helix-turn-helix transcriptional regulator [Bacteroidota bacterium]